MGFFHSENFDRPKSALPQRQQAILQSQGQLESDECLAAQRRAIPCVERMRGTLEEIEFAQAQLREAGASLQMVLTMAPLAEAYAQFKEEGGVTASDWTLWLDGETLGRPHPASKQHLRIVSVRHAPNIPRLGTARIAEEPEELIEKDAELAE